MSKETMKNAQIFLQCFLSTKGLQLVGSTLMLLLGLLLLAYSMVAFSPSAHAAKSRIKDVVSVEGIRDNILVGYGLVVGLNGTGDKMNNAILTEKSLKAYLTRLGLNTGAESLKVKNVAAVTVTATLAPFARTGSRMDVRISTMGDAKSLQGGTLIATPLVGADGEVYALAQGAVAIGGFEAKGKSGSSISKGVPTGGFIANGGIVEREIAFDLNSLSTLKFALRNPDVTTAKSIADAINASQGSAIAAALDPGTVEVMVPVDKKNEVSDFLASVETLEIEPDQMARILIDEDSGTIVMNRNVRIDTVAIAQGNLVVSIDETTQVSQPGAFAPEGAQTVQVASSQINVDEESGNKMAVMKSGASLRELVDGLNALGVGPRDLITILQSVKAAGALQAEIEVR